MIMMIMNVDTRFSCTTSRHMSTVVQRRRPVVQCQCLHTSALRRHCVGRHVCSGGRVRAISLKTWLQCQSFRHSIDLVLTTSAVCRHQVRIVFCFVPA